MPIGFNIQEHEMPNMYQRRFSLTTHKANAGELVKIIKENNPKYFAFNAKGDTIDIECAFDPGNIPKEFGQINRVV